MHFQAFDMLTSDKITAKLIFNKVWAYKINNTLNQTVSQICY